MPIPDTLQGRSGGYTGYACGAEVTVGADGAATSSGIDYGPSLATAVTIVNWKSEVSITKTREHDPSISEDVDATFAAYNEDTGTLYYSYNTDDGECTISDLPAGTYYLYEVDVEDGYYLEDQDGYLTTEGSGDASALKSAGFTSYVYCGTFELKNDGTYASKKKTDSDNQWSVTRDKTYTEVKIEITNKTGMLTLTKKGNKSSGLEDIEFVFVYYEDSGNGGDSGYSYVSGSAGSAKTYGSSYKKYSTDDDGEITLDYLREGTYYIYEVDVNWDDGNYYYLEDQDGYISSKNSDGYIKNYTEIGWVYCGTMEVEAGETTTKLTDSTSYSTTGKLTYINNLKSGALSIEKIDADGEDIEITAKFILVYYDENDYTYKFVFGDSKKATQKTYSTGTWTTYTATESIKIYSLRIGTYYIFETEVSNPEGYLLSYQDGYMEDPTDIMDTTGLEEWVYCGSATVKTNATVYVTITNVRAITITGYVWEDDVSKDGSYNSEYDEDSEHMISNVTVYLNLKSNCEIMDEWYTGSYEPETTYNTTTGTDGYYTFEWTILYRMLPYYCIEFDYTDGKYINDDGEEENLEKWYYDTNTSYNDGTSTMYLRSESETSYTPYIPVAYNAGTVPTKASQVGTNTSKAIMDEVETYDANINDNLATTYPSKYTSSAKSYDLSGWICEAFYDVDEDGNYDGSAELDNINLGIKELYDSEYTIAEDLLYVKIEINGYTYLYEYGYTDAGYDDDGNACFPTVSFQDDADTTLYTRYMYPSDLKEGLSDNGTLKVWLVYGITITNTTTYDVAERYSETNLTITNLTMSFNTTTNVTGTDENRLSLDNTLNTDDDESEYDQEKYCNDTFSQWSDNEDGTATYNFDTENSENVVAGGEDTTIFIQFQVTDAGLIEILEKGTDTATDEYVTTASSIAYHNYTRYDYSWENTITATQSHTTDLKYKSHSAGYMVFKLGTDRTLSGIVFEDTVDSTRTEEVVGDGIYNEDDENTVGNVKVELLNYLQEDADGTVVTNYTSGTTALKYDLYTDEETNVTKYEGQAFEPITTDETGEFTFEGFIPGQYFLKFTYYDENNTETQTKIYAYDSSTDEYTEVKTICINDYKSTIVTSDPVEDAIIAETQRESDGVTSDDGLWYRDYDNDKDKDYYESDEYIYSTATDDLDLREEYNDGLVYTYESNAGTIEDVKSNSYRYKTNDDGEYIDSEGNIVTSEDEAAIEEITTMEANTPMFEIRVENTTDTYSDEDTSETLHKLAYEGFNFGIITQPEQSVEIEKIITNVELTNTPNTIIDGNPAVETLTGTTSLGTTEDKATNKGSTYVRVEIEEDYLYGSTLTVTYTITITNTSQLNYYEVDEEHYGWYYMFGEYDTTNYSREVEITLDSVLDGNDPYLEWVVNGAGVSTETISISSTEATRTDITVDLEETTVTIINGEYTAGSVNSWEDESGTEYEINGDSVTLMQEVADDRSGSETKQYDYEELTYSATWGSVQIGESVYMRLSYSKVLSSADTDMSYENTAEINEMHVTESLNLLGSSSITKTKESSKLVKVPKLPTPSESYITISEPTGGDGISAVVYVIAGAVGLIILSAGVVIIKKKIL